MNKLFSIFFLLLSLQLVAQSDLPNAPVPPRLINDFTGNFLLKEQVAELERKVVAYDDSTSTQIAVIIVDDLKGRAADDYAISIGRKWGVGGQKQFSNGVVLLIATGAKDGKRKMFLATGYGTEAAVPDVLADRILQQVLKPGLQSGNEYAAIDKTIDAIINALAGKYKAPEGYNNRGESGGGLLTMVILIVVIFIIIAIISKGGGNGGGRYVSRRGYRDRDNWGGLPWIIPGGGGGWSGGGSSGGGGGFGGFGGGGFGGGGAGGDW